MSVKTDPFPIQIISISDSDAKWSKSIGLEKDLSSIGFGIRTARYALVIDDLVVTYVGVSDIWNNIFHIAPTSLMLNLKD